MAKLFLLFIALRAIILLLIGIIKNEEIGIGNISLITITILPLLILAWIVDHS
jgi:hypothetical protein